MNVPISNTTIKYCVWVLFGLYFMLSNIYSLRFKIKVTFGHKLRYEIKV
jgi:hypothetical protein